MDTTTEKLSYLIDTRERIRAAIIDKGVEAAGATFRQFAELIAEISGGGIHPEPATRGLYIHFDLHNNTGDGYDPSATVWKDLVGDRDGTIVNPVGWSDSGLRFGGNSVATRVDFRGDIPEILEAGGDYVFVVTAMSEGALTRHGRLFGESPFPTLNLTPDSNLFWYYRAPIDQTFRPEEAMAINKMTHLAIRYTALTRTIELFRNGLYIGGISGVGNAGAVAVAQLGNRPQGDRTLNGRICNFKGFAGRLSEIEIYQDFLYAQEQYGIED